MNMLKLSAKKLKSHVSNDVSNEKAVKNFTL